MNADNTFKILGYKKEKGNNYITYSKEWGKYDEESGYEEWVSFTFWLDTMTMTADHTYEPRSITMEELEAVYKKARELGWVRRV